LKGKVLKKLPNESILYNISNISESLLHLIGYVKINNMALEINFLEKIVANIIKKQKRIFYFDYYFLNKFKLSSSVLHIILGFLGFSKIAGTSNVSYWIKKKINRFKPTYDKDSPFYVLKKLQ
jgi:hypothetical protein